MQRRKIGRRLVMTIVVVGLIAVLSGCPNLFGGQNGNDEESFTVTYEANGAESGTVPEAQTKREGVDLTLSTNTGNLARTGFTFAGWNTGDDGSGTDYAEGATYTGDADVTLYAKWTQLLTYTVTYDANGAESGSAPVDQTKTEDVDLTLAGNTGNLARTGYTFAGWNSADDGSGTDYAEGATYTADADVTLYAQWTALPTYTVTYDANGADSGTAPEAQTKTEGADLTLANNTGNLARTGYTFAGWNSADDGGGSDYAEGASYTADADVTLYAKWTQLPTYTVTYDANGADSGTAPAEQTKIGGLDLTLANNTGTLARTGFDFEGWNSADDGSGSDYAEGASYTADADVTLYAKWTQLPTYTVTYDANGADSGTAPAEQTKIEGVDLTLANNSDNLARAGDSFSGWNTDDDGSGTSYAEGATYTADADVTLYANWTPDYAVGDTGPAGGIVFYDKGSYSDGWRYLEAAPSSTEWTSASWGGRGTDVNGNSATDPPELDGVGSGAANTQAIVSELGTGSYAAKLSDDLSHGGYDDWFLPSRDELGLVYQNLYQQNSGGFVSADYWSSSEIGGGRAWARAFSSGTEFMAWKDGNERARAIRAF